MKINRRLLRWFWPAIVCVLLSATVVDAASAQGTKRASTTPSKTFIDYFEPTPILSSLSTTAWGVATVGPRDVKNGLEDPTMKLWDYWDGQIIHGPDGKYHIFASRWDQSFGHNAWFRSKAVHAVSDNLIGPYIDKGLCWPDDQEGKGHNVTALVLPDGRYAIVVSESRPGDVFVSSSLDGPWKNLGKITLVPNEFSAQKRMSNVSIMVRPDGAFEIVPRSGRIWISKTGILGPYTVQGPPIYTTIPELAVRKPEYLEDPAIWFSGGLFHIIVNDWNDRRPSILRRSMAFAVGPSAASHTTPAETSFATPTVPSTTGTNWNALAWLLRRVGCRGNACRHRCAEGR